MTAEPLVFSIKAADVPAAGRSYHVRADEEQNAALAALLEIVAIEELEAELEVRPVSEGLSVRGRLSASVVQTDIVSLEPIRQKVTEDIDVTLVPAEAAGARRKPDKLLVDAAEADGPDLYRNGRIDLGMIVREHLALGLDPYPRESGAVFLPYIEDDPAADPSPFAALSALKTDGE